MNHDSCSYFKLPKASDIYETQSRLAQTKARLCSFRTGAYCLLLSQLSSVADPAQNLWNQVYQLFQPFVGGV